MDQSNTLLVENVCKMYDDRHGIDSVSMRINAGEITAVVGPNGVGKTTLLKVIAGLLRASQGQISFMGKDTFGRECKADIGFMQDDLSFYYDMTIYEVLDFICKVKYNGKFREEIDSCLNDYRLFEYRNFKIGALSMGLQKKTAIIMALLGTPGLLLFDEPTNGVDTNGIIQFKKDMVRCAQKGSIVIVASHVLDFLEKIASRVIFLQDGRIIEDIANDGRNLEEIYREIYG